MPLVVRLRNKASLLACHPLYRCYMTELLTHWLGLTKVEACEGGYHPDDIVVLQIRHYLYLLEISLLIDLIGKLFLL